ncbi:MAG TPA: SpoIIE family protein phosphatase, partial [Bacteroidia bacterium]
ASLFEKKGDYRSAYEYYKLFTTTKDSILNKENSKLITEMNTKYSTEKKDLELATKRIELQRQRAISISVFVGLILILLLASLLLSRYRLKKKANKKLQVAYDEIEEKNKVIAKSNLRTTDSINYAKCIQDAILPAPEEIQKLLSDFFILYKPCQIVSGDFYWCSTQNNKIIVIVADCTGHGVPGAFMSMIGNTLLNEIINERKVTDPENIAQLLNEKIVEAMRQDASNGPNQHDGMDISICCIDQANKTITFTGANHKLYTYNGRLEKIKGDPFSIGGSRLEGLKKFSSKTISIEPDTRIYLQTDGYRDQSGGPDKKKFSSSQFETLLENIQGLSMGEQKEKLDATFEEWKGDMAQRDDVLVMGIKC